MYVVINTAEKRIVSQPQCYQEAARIGNKLDAEVGKVVHSLCDENAIRGHEVRFGALTPYTDQPTRANERACMEKLTYSLNAYKSDPKHELVSAENRRVLARVYHEADLLAIVNACNAHDKLVAALKLAEEALEHSKPKSHYDEAAARHDTAWKAVKAALVVEQ